MEVGRAPAGSFYGSARRYHWFAGGELSSWYSHSRSDTAGNHAVPACHSTRCRGQSECAIQAAFELLKTRALGHSVDLLQ